MKKTEIEILPLAESDRAVAAFLAGYSVQSCLEGRAFTVEKTALAIKNGIILKNFVKAMQSGKLVGLVSCCDSRSRPIEITREDVSAGLGRFSADKKLRRLEDVFYPKNLPNVCGYVSLLTTASISENISKMLLSNIISSDKYSLYFSFVPKNDEHLVRIYRECGFAVQAEYDKSKEKSEGNDAFYYGMVYQKQV